MRRVRKNVFKHFQFLINDARERRCERLDAEPTSFIEVFLDKIDDNQDDPDSLYTRKFSMKNCLSFVKLQQLVERFLRKLFQTHLQKNSCKLFWKI